MSNRSQAGILNPHLSRNTKISLTKNLTQLTRDPKNMFNNNNSNLYTNNSIRYNPVTNPIENVFVTQIFNYNSNKSEKILQQSTTEIRDGLFNNKNNLKNHKIFGRVKTLLIQEQGYNEAGVFIGTAKIWLLFNSNLGIFDYVIEIKPSQHFTSNTNKITRTIIPFIIQKLDISLIINALKKFGVENINEEIARKNSKNFRWSFHIQSIPRESNLTLSRKPKINNNNI